jgi:hypothetical protein
MINEIVLVFVAVIIWNAKCMCRILLSFVACWTEPYFYQLSHKRHFFFWETILSIKCVYRICLIGSSEMFLILKRNGRNIFINIHSCKQTFKLHLKYFNEFEFSEKIYGRFPIIKFNEFLGVLDDLCHRDEEKWQS